MAYAALVSLAQTLDHVLEKKHLQSLHDNIVSLLNFLDEFPREATKLEARITVTANRVEDIFELHMLEKNGSIYAGPNLQELCNEIDSIVKEAMEIKSSCTSEKQMISTHSSASLSSTRRAPNVEGVVVGFEQDLLEIKVRIYGESAKLEVIPIVGMGGIGKTTLARYALHDPWTTQHFDVSAFVSVSQNYNKASILLCLLNSIDPSSKGIEFKNESLIHERVYKYLKGRRFLVVVDDVWNVNAWDHVRRVFPEDFNGSRIIITTRDLNVASKAGSCSYKYEMNLMSVDLGWNLLRQKVFQDEQFPLEVVEIGRHIAEKCGGLPLAIVAIAGVLPSKLDGVQHAWKKMAVNVNEAVNSSNEPFAEILSLSYTYMPHHLRPCFLYMGGFPEDEEIHASKLIRLWVAEGFLKSNGSKDLEEVAEDYLEELARRSVVLINKKRYNGKIKSIKMHDLLRDLCLRKAADEKFLNVIDECGGHFSRVIENSRRLSMLSNSWGCFGNMDSPIHTLLVSCHWHFEDYERLRLLRVADLMLLNLSWEGAGIGELLHLRYLALICEPTRKSNIITIPKFLSNLQNLQTLVLNASMSTSIMSLPLGIWRMQELRQIIILDGFLPEPSADQISPLEKLHTVKRIHGFICSKRILELIPNLKKLGIAYSSFDINKTYRYKYVGEIYKKEWSEYCLNNLVHLQKLENFNFHADPHDYDQSNLSRRLAFPVTLKKLTLSGSGIPWEDMSIVGSLPNLQVLKLKRHACRGLVWQTVEEQFCQLKVLVIDSTDPDDWRTEKNHFPMLERLILHGCYNLREIPNEIGDIATLQLIEVHHCNSAVVDSAKCIEEEQRDYGNQLQLHLNVAHVSEMGAL